MSVRDAAAIASQAPNAKTRATPNCAKSENRDTCAYRPSAVVDSARLVSLLCDRMTAFRRLLALALLTLWVPATQHCSLEAAGLFPDACGDDGCAPGELCSDDGCGTLESVPFKTPVMLVKAPAPYLQECLCCRHETVIASAEDDLIHAASERRDRPRDWVPEWHFVRRTAPPTRAPAPVAA